jgi:uncharacterized protein (DUF983 family)
MAALAPSDKTALNNTLMATRIINTPQGFWGQAAQHCCSCQQGGIFSPFASPSEHCQHKAGQYAAKLAKLLDNALLLRAAQAGLTRQILQIGLYTG